MSQVITDAFASYWQQCLVDETPVELDEFVLAYVPGLDPDAPIDPASGLPLPEQIVHRHPVDQRGRINNDAVAYSIVMDTTVGDFTFNAMYLINSALNLVAMIVHKGDETKLKTDPANGQTGNSLVKSMLMEYDRAAEASETVIDASTWQIDYAARLRGMDEDLRRQALGTFGQAAFYGDGFKLVNASGLYKVQPGQGYVGGLLALLTSEQEVTPSAKPMGLWLDVYRAGTLLSPWVNHLTLTLSAADLVDYVDANGYPHFVTKLAVINADDSVTDTRTRRTLTLTGDVTGEASFNGPDSIQLEVAIKDNSHAHTIENVAGLAQALEGKADTEHTHTPGEAGAAPAEHGHEMADVEGLDEALAAKHAMAQIVLQAPAGAVTGTWYPVLVHLEVGSSGTPVNIHTVSGGSSLPMNCSSFAGTVGAGGWTDRGSQYSGEFYQYEPDEISLSCMTVPSESADAVAFYVDGAAFPVAIEYRDTLPPPVTGTSVVYGTSTFTPSTTPHVGAGTKTQLLAPLDAGSGFYSARQGRLYGKNSRPTPAEVGALAVDGSNVMTGQLTTRAASAGAGVRGTAQGGSFASEYGRWAPFVTDVNHTGSSYAPSFQARYARTNEYAGLFSFGVLTASLADPGTFCIHHINENSVEDHIWMFKHNGRTLLPVTPTPGSNDNQAATTAFVMANSARGTHTHTAAQGNADVIASGYGQVGSYALAQAVSADSMTIGATIAGSNLRPVAMDVGNWDIGGAALSGTWKLFGDNNSGRDMMSLYVRIDAASLFEHPFMLSDMAWNNADHNSLTTTVTFIEAGETMPWTVTKDDIEAHGRWLFAMARDGEFGPIAEYVPPTDLEVATRDNPKTRQRELAYAIAQAQHWEMMGAPEQANAWRDYYQALYALEATPDWPMVELWPEAPQ